MNDMKLIQENREAFEAAMIARGLDGVVIAEEALSIDRARRERVTRLQEAQTRRNELTRLIKDAMAKNPPVGELHDEMEEVIALKSQIDFLKRDDKSRTEGSDHFLALIPNVPAPDVPVGGEEANVVLRQHGNAVGGDVPEHDAIGRTLRLMDFDRAAKMSGSRFVILRGRLASLERALGQFMIDLHVNEHGYEEVAAPLLVRAEALFGTGQLPKFEEDLFIVEAVPELHLIPTAEVTLTNMVRETIVAEEELPLRLTALTPCFRAEAGAAGRDVTGMIRQHQFMKCELVSVTTPEQARDEHERMLANAEQVLKRLGLAYRVVLLATGDMGFSARKTYDIEVWLPGQKRYREISSVSDCGDFQARRMNAKFKRADRSKGLVHTLNGSGVAVGRALIAIMETYWRDGGIDIPDELVPYMGSAKRIEGR